MDGIASQRAFRGRTNDAVTDGEIVWSWHPGADAERNAPDALSRHGGKKAGPRGERV
jgi:hypothetical protein